MASAIGHWCLKLDSGDAPARELIGGKAWSIARMQSLKLPVPPAFVISTRACTAFMQEGHEPAELASEIDEGMAWLQGQTGKTFGHGDNPLLVSVRSGAPVSMPGMMDTVLNLGINDDTEAALARASGNVAFARDTHRRFLDLYTHIVLRATPPTLDAGAMPAQWREQIAQASGQAIPATPREQLTLAVRAVFESWNSRRAKRYRKHHDIPDDLGTAVTVQAMVFGNLDEASGTGVLFTRNPLNGTADPYGEYLARAQGEDVVSGRATPAKLDALQAQLPQVHAQLIAAGRQLEREHGDVQDIEFTVERGTLWLLQSRAAKRAALAALNIAVDLVEEGRIDPAEAVRRVSPEQLATLTRPSLSERTRAQATVLASGESACPGVGIGVVVSDPDEAERRAAAGEDVVLARITTSPEDLHGMMSAKAIVTEQGGSTSHAAVVSRSLGVPCVVGCGADSVSKLAGRTVSVDGGSGQVFDGELATVSPEDGDNPRLARFLEWKSAQPLDTPT